MLRSAPSPCPFTGRPLRQRGVYALEWAIIFPVFFVLLYAIVCYGLTFLVRESMQHAVEEGARAAMRYPVGKDASTWNDRKLQALTVVKDSLDWLPPALRPTDARIQFTVCLVSNAGCTHDSPMDANLPCDAQAPCLVVVSYAIHGYQDNAIAPHIPGLGLILPSTLTATASILVDQALL